MDLWVYTMKGGDASQGCAFHRNRKQGNANLPCKRLKDIKCSAKKKKKDLLIVNLFGLYMTISK